MKLDTEIKNQWTRVRASWDILSKNKIISLTTTASLILFVIGVGAIAIFWNKLPPVVPLWYSKPWGTDRLANPLWLFLLPGSSLAITGINIYIASMLTSEYLVFSQTLSLSSFVISILSIITLIKIITLML